MTDPDRDVGKFEIALPDGESLRTGDTVTHAEFGPMAVENIVYAGSYKEVTLVSELGPEALELTGDELRGRWGETIADDPLAIQTPTVEYEGISLPDADHALAVDLSVTGDEMDALEPLAVYTHDRIVRAMQALDRGAHPDDCEGIEIDIDWETIHDQRDGDRA
jgi:hypothetical protein